MVPPKNRTHVRSGGRSRKTEQREEEGKGKGRSREGGRSRWAGDTDEGGLEDCLHVCERGGEEENRMREDVRSGRRTCTMDRKRTGERRELTVEGPQRTGVSEGVWGEGE